MKNARKITLIALFICAFTSFISFGMNEGMAAIKYSTNERVWKYYTGVESEYGYSEYLKNQWKQVKDEWYYFGEDGYSKQNTWAEIDGKWYYFDQWSIMQHDTTTPDGHTVGSDGAWIPGEGEAAPVQD